MDKGNSTNFLSLFGHSGTVCKYGVLPLFVVASSISVSVTGKRRVTRSDGEHESLRRQVRESDVYFWRSCSWCWRCTTRSVLRHRCWWCSGGRHGGRGHTGCPSARRTPRLLWGRGGSHPVVVTEGPPKSSRGPTDDEVVPGGPGPRRLVESVVGTEATYVGHHGSPKNVFYKLSVSVRKFVVVHDY